jgi:hypothetical protein
MYWRVLADNNEMKNGCLSCSIIYDYYIYYFLNTTMAELTEVETVKHGIAPHIID